MNTEGGNRNKGDVYIGTLNDKGEPLHTVVAERDRRFPSWRGFRPGRFKITEFTGDDRKETVLTKGKLGLNHERAIKGALKRKERKKAKP